MCIQNSCVHFVKASTKWYDSFPSPLEAEAMGMCDAISWIDQLGLSKMQIELDCKRVVDSIVDRSNNKSEFDNIVLM